MSAEDIENIMKVSGSAFAAGVGLVNLFKAYHKSQPALKLGLRSDIEILKLIDSADPNYQLIKQRIDAAIRRLYGDPERAPGILGVQVYSLGALILGLVLSLGFGYWTYNLYVDGKPWWSYVLTGFFTFGGVGNILIAFDASSTKAKQGDSTGPSTDRTAEGSETLPKERAVTNRGADAGAGAPNAGNG